MDLPYIVSEHKMVSFEDNQQTYLIGGKEGEYYNQKDNILKLICKDLRPENCKFEEQSVKLKYARSGHIAIPIPGSIAFDLCLSRHDETNVITTTEWIQPEAYAG